MLECGSTQALAEEPGFVHCDVAGGAADAGDVSEVTSRGGSGDAGVPWDEQADYHAWQHELIRALMRETRDQMQAEDLSLIHI